MDPAQTKIYIAVLTACIIIGIIIAYFIISLIRHQRRYVQATRRNVLAEISLLEQDRMRIAADLHDELAPVLSAVKFQIDSVDTADATDQEVLNTSKSQVDFLAVRLREIAKDLMPAALSKKGLSVALNEFFDGIRKGSRLNIIFKYEVLTEIPADQRINLYRIIQEITHNTIKHANATSFLVQIIQTNNIINVLCEDNGRGFNYNKLSGENTGLGLRNIKGRADIIGSNFSVKSVIGKGTQYTFDIPLKEHGYGNSGQAGAGR
jgi:two-component system, NarL family, sensor kinase